MYHIELVRSPVLLPFSNAVILFIAQNSATKQPALNYLFKFQFTEFYVVDFPPNVSVPLICISIWSTPLSLITKFAHAPQTPLISATRYSILGIAMKLCPTASPLPLNHSFSTHDPKPCLWSSLSTRFRSYAVRLGVSLFDVDGHGSGALKLTKRLYFS